MRKISILISFLLLTILSFGQMKVTTTGINLRSSPEATENKICQIPKGTVISIVQDSIEVENWAKVNFNGKVGYVNNTYLKDFLSNSTYSSPTSNTSSHYTNSNGNTVKSPSHYDAPPEGASAVCNDGTYSFSQHRRGTCSHHGGVRKWL